MTMCKRTPYFPRLLWSLLSVPSEMHRPCVCTMCPCSFLLSFSVVALIGISNCQLVLLLSPSEHFSPRRIASFQNFKTLFFESAFRLFTSVFNSQMCSNSTLSNNLMYLCTWRSSRQAKLNISEKI